MYYIVIHIELHLIIQNVNYKIFNKNIPSGFEIKIEKLILN